MNNKEYLGCRKNNQRLSFTKDFKRIVLIELSIGKKPEEVINKLLEGNLMIQSADKKYYAKLIHKWKKEVYANRKMLAFTSINPTNKNIDIEIANIGDEDEIGNIAEELRLKYLKKKKFKGLNYTQY